MKDYLVGIGFSASNLPEGIMPQKEDESSRSKYDQFCGTVRDPGFERCLNLKFIPIAAVAREASCLAKHAACTVDNVKTCLVEACMLGCPGSNSQCAQACGGGNIGSCNAGCDDALCTTIFGVDICVPGLHDICTAACGLFSSNKDTCVEAAVDEAACGLEHIRCGVDGIIQTLSLNNHADKLLKPAKDACNTVDDALAFVECLKGDPAQTPEVRAAARRTCLIDACAASGTMPLGECTELMDDVDAALAEVERVKETISKVADVLENRPAHEFVNLAFLKEDMLADPAYFTDLKDSVADTRADLLANPPPPGASSEDVELYNRKLDTLDRFDKLADDIDAIKAGGTGSGDPLVDIRDAATEAGDILATAAELGLIPTTVGPTARRILADIGPSFRTTFIPFFNTLQGMKVAPLASAGDIDGLYEQETVDNSLLPWRNGDYSAACKGSGLNPYCDVLKSFDDPNCMNCTGLDLEPSGPFNWVRGRGLVPWNKYDPTTPVRHVVTNFMFTSTDASYDELYTRIFQVPETLPIFAGFEDPERPWTSTNGQVSIDHTNKTEGTGSLSLANGCGYTRLDSPTFMTTEWGVVGTELWLDVYVPPAQSNPSWVGDLQISVSIPGANINNTYLTPWVGLTDRPRGAWSTLKYFVPANVQTALLADFANAQFNIHLNLGSCSQPLLLDNLRFSGTLKKRELFHVRGSLLHDVTSNSIFSFDNRSDWSAAASLSSSTNHVEGSASLAVSAGGFTPIQTRPFNTSELSGVTNRMSLDLFIPKPQPNQYWYGDVQLFMSCGSLNNSFIGQQPLTHRFMGEFNTLDFQLTPQQVTTLRGSFSNCTVTVALNVNPSGTFLLDNLGFY